jgi:hypothetical protein
VRKTNIVILITAAVAWVAIQARATIAYDNVAYNYPGSLAPNGQNGPYTIGNTFTVNSAIDVDELGIYEPADRSFNGSISVAIYAINVVDEQLQGSTLAVAPVSFSGASSGTQVAGTSTYMKTVGTVLLNPGTYMVVANNYGNSGALPYYDSGLAPSGQITGNTGGGALTFGASYREAGVDPLGGSLDSPLSWGFYDMTIPRMAAGNFGFFTVVPEASVFGGVAIAMLGLVYVGRRAWLKHTAA